DLAESERIHSGVEAGEGYEIEDVVGLKAKFQGTVIADLDGLADRHVQRKLRRAFNNVPPGVSVRGPGRGDAARRRGHGAERGGIEPFEAGRIAEGDRLTRNVVGAL